MKLDINLTDVEIKEFEPIPAGTYELRVNKGEVKQKPGSEYAYVAWEFEVVDDPEHEGNKVFHNTSLNPKALQMPSGLKAMWDALALPLDDVNVPDAVGLILTADIGQEIYQERFKNNIQRFHYDG